MNIKSKFPHLQGSVFSQMSKLAHETNAINLSQGFPNFDCNDTLKELVSKYLYDNKNQYAPVGGIPVLQDQIANKVFSLYKNDVNPRDCVTMMSGASEGIANSIFAFVNKGEEVIIIEPSYTIYKPLIDLIGGKTIIYELEGPYFEINWEQFGTLISPKTKMIIINTPHNPIGTTLEEQDLLELQKITEGTDIIILSDEVYEHITFDNKKHQSVLKFPELFKRSIAVFSFGKTYHVTGWRMGYCVAPSHLTAEIRKTHQINVFCVPAFLQHALTDYMSNPKTYLELSSFFEQKRDLFYGYLKQSKFKAEKCSGTYFQTAKFDGISSLSDLDFSKELVLKYGVAVIPLSVFYTSRKDHKMVRFCFAKTEDVLEQAGLKLKDI